MELGGARAGYLLSMPIVAALLLALLPQQSCPNCLHKGVLPCRAHNDVAPEEEEPSDTNPILYCSWVADCPACGGTMYVDCPRCEKGDLSDKVAERRALIAAWREQNTLEKTLGRSVPRLESKRFSFVIDVPQMMDTKGEGKKKMSAHVLAHRLAEDEEHVTALIAQHYAMTDKDYRAKMRMWLWNDLATHQQAQQKFQGTVTTGDFKMLGRDPVFSVWDEPGNFDTVPKIRALFAHNAAHMLLSNAFNPTWVGDIGGGWLDAGLGAWYEYELFGRSVNYCLEEATLAEDYENGQWRAAVRRELEKEKQPCLPALLPKRTGALSAPEHALCWSFYDWLLATHAGVVRTLMLELKQKKPAREVLAAALGMDLFATEDAWRAWVSETYPLKGDKPSEAKPDPKKGAKKK